MKRLLAGLALVAIAATGCGGGSAKKQSLTPASTPSPSASVEATLPSLGGSADCLKAAAAYGKAATAFAPTNDQDLYSLFTGLGKQLLVLKSAVSDDKVKEALDTLSQAYTSAGEKLKGVTYKPAAGGVPPAAYLEAIRTFGEPKFAAAGRVLTAYFGTCKH